MWYLETQGVLNLVELLEVGNDRIWDCIGYDVPDHVTIHVTGNSPALLTQWAVVS